MKRYSSVVLFLAIALLFGSSSGALAETVGFTKPTTYDDATTIAPAESALMQTSIEYRVLPSSTWVTFGTATGGASSLILPYVTHGNVRRVWRGGVLLSGHPASGNAQ
jgi:hypothetical protein